MRIGCLCQANLALLVEFIFLYNAGGVHRKEKQKLNGWMEALKTERDTHDITALALISEQVADEVKNLSDKFNLSVSDVLTQAVGLLQRSGLEKHRSSVRHFWEALTPEERKARASRASRARWDREKAKKSETSEQLELQGDPKTAGP